MMSVLKSNNHCFNCLKSGHYIKYCNSLHRCSRYQKPHHTLLHKEYSGESHARKEHHILSSQPELPVTPVSSHAAMGIKANMLLMTAPSK